MREHRVYQSEALECAYNAYHERGVRRMLIQIFTGGGKTVVFASMPAFLGFKKKTMFLVHTDELAQQAADKIRDQNPGFKVGIEMGDTVCDPDDTYIVGSVPTLGREGSVRLQKFNPEDFDLVVIDEGHHATADSYLRIQRHFGFASDLPLPATRLLLLVTATTKRGDGVGLEIVVDEIVYEFSMRRAIKEGWQVDFRGYSVVTEESLDQIRDINTDKRALSLAVNTPRRNGLLVDKWLEVGEGGKTIGFTVDIDHAKGLAQAFVDKGIMAKAIWGNDPEREQKLKDHRAGEFLILLACGMLIEGYDDPGIINVILARPSESSLFIEQAIGRGGRLPTGINNLHEARAAGTLLTKDHCNVIDATDNTRRHKCSTLPSLLGLPPKLKMNGELMNDLIEKFEVIKDANPDVDMDGLTDINDVNAYLQTINLFDFSFCDEVMLHSELQWHKTPKGNYLLLLPNHERVTIIKNLLNKWTINGVVRGSSFTDYEDDVPSALHTADTMLKMLGRQLWSGAKRTSGVASTKVLASPSQIEAITQRLTKLGNAIPNMSRLSSHEAAKMLIKLYLPQ